MSGTTQVPERGRDVVPRTSEDALRLAVVLAVEEGNLELAAELLEAGR